MDTILKIISSAEFWTIAAPAFIAVGAWYINEKSKRIQQEYERKEESYKDLLRTLRGFYITSHDTKLKNDFLHQLNLCWLYAPDQVIIKSYEFLRLVHIGVEATNEQKELAVGELVAVIRKDIISRKIVNKTNLKPSDFKHLYAT